MRKKTTTVEDLFRCDHSFSALVLWKTYPMLFMVDHIWLMLINSLAEMFFEASYNYTFILNFICCVLIYNNETSLS